jgi:hypothetical protein
MPAQPNKPGISRSITRRARFIHALFKIHFQAAGFVPFTAGYAARSSWIPCITTNS